jgi:hypothetical protein
MAPRTCPECNTQQKRLDAKFCWSCGFDLRTVPEPEPEPELELEILSNERVNLLQFDESLLNMDDLDELLIDLPTGPTCTTCGAMIEHESAFCVECGAYRTDGDGESKALEAAIAELEGEVWTEIAPEHVTLSSAHIAAAAPVLAASSKPQEQTSKSDSLPVESSAPAPATQSSKPIAQEARATVAASAQVELFRVDTKKQPHQVFLAFAFLNR